VQALKGTAEAVPFRKKETGSASANASRCREITRKMSGGNCLAVLQELRSSRVRPGGKLQWLRTRAKQQRGGIHQN